MPQYLLSESDRAAIAALIGTDMRKSRNTPNRNRTSDDVTVTPEVYIAKTPEDGIPALTAANPMPGTGTTDYDRPRFADCDIYQVVYDSDVAELHQVGFTVRVLNLQTSSIPGNIWVSVKKDKYGSWLSDNVGSSLSVNYAFDFANLDYLTIDNTYQEITRATALEDGWYAASSVVTVSLISTVAGGRVNIEQRSWDASGLQFGVGRGLEANLGPSVVSGDVGPLGSYRSIGFTTYHNLPIGGYVTIRGKRLSVNEAGAAVGWGTTGCRVMEQSGIGGTRINMVRIGKYDDDASNG